MAVVAVSVSLSVSTLTWVVRRQSNSVRLDFILCHSFPVDRKSGVVLLVQDVSVVGKVSRFLMICSQLLVMHLWILL